MKRILLLISIAFLGFTGLSQTADEAVQYLDNLTADSEPIAKNMLRYASASVHSRTPAAVERKRMKLVRSIEDARDRIAEIPGFDGSFEFRNAVYKYYKTSYQTMNLDYAQINKMGEIAEDSFELMERYIRADEEANRKLDIAYNELQEAQKSFAAKYNITISEDSSPLQQQLDKASAVNEYYNNVFLLFFKPFKEDVYMAEAIQSNNTAKIEEHRNKLIEYTNASLATLNEMETFDGDASIIDATKSIFQFFLDDAENYAPKAIEFINDQHEFATMQAAMDKKKRKDLTQKDVDAFNAMVDKVNSAVGSFNDLSERYFQMRGQRIDNFNRVGDAFHRNHTPVYGDEEDGLHSS